MNKKTKGCTENKTLLKVYISGPITGVANYKRVFAEETKIAKSKIEKKLYLPGVSVNVLPFNPAAKMGHVDGMPYEDCLELDFKLIDLSDLVYFMPGWEKSKGAVREWHYAKSKLKLCAYSEKPKLQFETGPVIYL